MRVWWNRRTTTLLAATVLVAASVYAQNATGDDTFTEGNEWYNAGSYLQAAETYQRAAELYLASDNPANAGHAYAWAGSGYLAAGEIEASASAYGLAIETLLENGETWYAGQYLLSLAGIHQQQGDLRRAEAATGRALALFEANLSPLLADAETRNAVLGQIASTAITLGDLRNRLFLHAEAVAPLERALAALEELQVHDQNYINALYGLGFAFRASGRYRRALETYADALVYAEENQLTADQIQIVQLQSAVAVEGGELDTALERAEYAAALAREAGTEGYFGVNENNIGTILQARGEYEAALGRFERAADLYRQHGDVRSEAMAVNNIANLYDTIGNLDRSAEFYERSIQIARDAGFAEDIPTYLNNLGLVYMKWGAYSQATDYFSRALEAADAVNQIGIKSNIYASIGNVALKMGDFASAGDNFLKSYEIDSELGIAPKTAVGLINLGTVAQQEGELDLAAERYNEALAIAQANGLRDLESTAYNNVGNVMKTREEYGEALAYYERALEIDRQLGNPDALATLLSNIGAVHFRMGQFGEARDFFTEAVTLLETLRATAPGALRREYLASQISTYNWLIATYVHLEDSYGALDIAELASAKYLEEQLGMARSPGADGPADSAPTNGDGYAATGWGGAAFDAHAYVDDLESGTTVLVFSNVTWSQPVSFIATSGKLRYALYSHGWNDEILPAATVRNMQRALRRVTGRISEDDALGDAVTYYRYLLAKPLLRPAEREDREALARALYATFVAPIEGEFAPDTRELLIVPDGPLALIPLESLLDSEGHYLVEKYDVRYAHSLSVESLVARREYAMERKPLLAMGGAVYDRDTYADAQEAIPVAATDEAITAVRRTVASGGTRGMSSGENLETLGYKEWTNLPGSLSEVRALSDLIPGSTLVTGAEVREEVVKSRDLDSYAVIHFATHGIVVPEVPELSSLVLSQNLPGSGEDGYLNVQEIASLRLRADLVTLSACQTGLGALYPGEGVVGLNQAFLIAGANGLVVSLWSVSDESTREFMVRVYSLAADEGLSYSAAINQTKREFIRDGEYGEPFAWAPFVYYGR